LLQPWHRDNEETREEETGFQYTFTLADSFDRYRSSMSS